jgi:hypothetical protein
MLRVTHRAKVLGRPPRGRYPQSGRGFAPASEVGHNPRAAMARRSAQLLGTTEAVVGDLIAWCLLLLGVLFGLGALGPVELLTRLSGS